MWNRGKWGCLNIFQQFQKQSTQLSAQSLNLKARVPKLYHRLLVHYHKFAFPVTAVQEVKSEPKHTERIHNGTVIAKTATDRRAGETRSTIRWT